MAAHVDEDPKVKCRTWACGAQASELEVPASAELGCQWTHGIGEKTHLLILQGNAGQKPGRSQNTLHTSHSPAPLSAFLPFWLRPPTILSFYHFLVLYCFLVSPPPLECFP